MSELLNKVRTLIRTRHYSYRTEHTYVFAIEGMFAPESKRHRLRLQTDRRQRCERRQKSSDNVTC
jgi:hypothetical protein